MKTSELAEKLGISPQMCNRLKKRGMPCDSLQSAIEWRKRNLDLTQTKSWRIDGNQGVKLVSIETLGDDRAFDSETARRVLTHTIPDLWFSQVNRLDTALKEHGVTLSAEKLLEVQATLFLLYQIETDRYLKIEAVYQMPDIFMIRPEHENYGAMIKSLEQCLNRPAAA
ncbi:MAG: hypothetical protein DU481_07695 [Nitrosomonas sp.]|uniref:hypothetical protein n=1 Tax=Nitrosomonas sp. TaxID=42353 RepID=UPI0032EAE48D